MLSDTLLRLQYGTVTR